MDQDGVFNAWFQGRSHIILYSFSTQRHELEWENGKLKRDLNNLRKSLSSESGHLMPPAPGSRPYNTLLAQLNSSNEELEIRKEEVLLLHSHMIRQDALKRRVCKRRNPLFSLRSFYKNGCVCDVFPTWISL